MPTILVTLAQFRFKRETTALRYKSYEDLKLVLPTCLANRFEYISVGVEYTQWRRRGARHDFPAFGLISLTREVHMRLMNRILVTLSLSLLPGIGLAQTCRWDGTAPWCSGSCGSGETEMARVSDLPEHWKQAFPIAQNTNFGAACVFGSKALCCKASAGSQCRWDGTAPFCDGECGPGEVAAAPPAGSTSGAACVTGQKKFCCRAAVGSSRQALTSNPKLTEYATIWEKSPGPAWQARHGLTSQQYQQTFDELVRQGYRPVDVSGYSVGGQPTYAAIFEKRAGPEFAAFHGITGDAYQREFDRLTQSGYHPVFVDGFAVGNADRYNAIFEKAPAPPWVARHNLDSASYQREFDRLTREGYRPVVVSGYNVNGQDRYAAIWEKRSSVPWVARHGMTSAQYQQEFNRLGQQGYRVVTVSGWRSTNEPRFAAIWEKVDGPPWLARHQMLADGYQEEFDKFTKEGYRLKVVSGYHMYD
ncbi:hypothetical protein LJR296_006854 [Cupriavidus necator]